VSEQIAAVRHGGTAPRPEAEIAVARRYGTAEPAIAEWNDTIALLLAHRSVRGYLTRPLAPGVIETLVAAASSAPTSSNVQAWSVVAVTDPAKRARLAQIAGGQKHILDAPVILVWVADLSRAARVAQRQGTELVGIDYTDTFLVASIDAVLAAQNALVAAESLGLGAVYIGALRNDPAGVAELLSLPPHAFAVVGLVVGHPDPAVATAVKPRLPQEVVLHRESYDPSRDAGIARHDADTLAFRETQRLPAQSWSELVTGRLRSIASLNGRHVLRDTLARLGLPLK
jgi:nitroreductase